MIRRHNGHGIDPTLASAPKPAFGCGHFPPVGITAVFGDADVAGAGGRAPGIARQGSGHKFELIVQARRHTMHGADKCAAPATNHTQFQTFMHRYYPGATHIFPDTDTTRSHTTRVGKTWV